MGKRGYELTLGGDNYLVTLPTHKLLTSILAYPNLPEDLAVDFRRNVLCQEWNFNNTRMFLPFVPSSNSVTDVASWMHRDSFFVWNVDENKITTLHWARLAYRPVLIPLDKQGNLDLSLRAQNPDGSIVSGFEIEWGETIGGDNIPNFRDSAGGEPIRWMWWDGILVAAEAMREVEVRALFDFDLLNDSLAMVQNKKYTK